jgi:hypothetical protein
MMRRCPASFSAGSDVDDPAEFLIFRSKPVKIKILP